MTKVPNIVHVGLAKTGSTFLQRRVFPRLPATELHTSAGGAMASSFRWVFKLNGPWLPLELSRATKRRKLERIFDTEYRGAAYVPASNPGYRLLISSEGMVGVSYDPLLNADLAARIIAKQIPDARILICLRRQDEWSASLYRQLVFAEDRFRRFLTFDDLYGSDEGDAIVPLSALAWHRLVEIYQTTFGAGNVCVLPYEQMVKAPQAYMQSLLEFLQVADAPDFDLSQRENVRASQSCYTRGSWTDRLRRLAGGVRDGNSRFVYELNGIRRDLTGGGSDIGRLFEDPLAERRAAILAAVRDSNRRLSAISGLDFSAYGYH